jgi:transposase
MMVLNDCRMEGDENAPVERESEREKVSATRSVKLHEYICVVVEDSPVKSVALVSFLVRFQTSQFVCVEKGLPHHIIKYFQKKKKKGKKKGKKEGKEKKRKEKKEKKRKERKKRKKRKKKKKRKEEKEEKKRKGRRGKGRKHLKDLIVIITNSFRCSLLLSCIFFIVQQM